MENNDDLPKSIVVILVVLAVAISVLGTFTVLSELSRLDKAPVRSDPVQLGKVRFTVENPNPPSSNVVGKVAFQVIDSEV